MNRPIRRIAVFLVAASLFAGMPAAEARVTALPEPAPRELAAEEPGPQAATQDPAQSATESAGNEVPPEPQAIPATEIPTQVEAANRRLATITTLIERDPQVEEADLDLFEADMDQEFARVRNVDLNTTVLRTLDDFREVWLGYRRDLAPPLATVNNRFRDLQEQRLVLARMAEEWQATLESLTQPEEVPEELAATLRGRVTGVLAEIAATASALQGRSDEVLAIQNAVSSLDAQVSEALATLDGLGNEIRGRVLYRDAPPLWGAGTGNVGELSNQARDAVGDRIETTRDFFRRRSDEATIHLIVFLAFAAIGFGLRRRSDEWQDVGAANPLRTMLERPVSMAAIFALLVGSWIYTGMPTSVTDLFLIVTLLPVLRLAPQLAPATDRLVVHGILGLYLANRCIGLMAEGSGLRRLSLLLVSVIAFVGVLRVVRARLGIDPEGRSSMWRFGASCLRLAVLLLAVAVAANLFGWTRLAWVLTAGTISSAYAAVILWLFVAGAEGLAAVIPLTRVGDILPSFRRRSADVTRVITIAARLFALWVWVDATLTWFLLRAPLGQRLDAFANDTFNLGGLQGTYGSLAAGLLVLLVAPLVSRTFRFFFMEEICPRLALPRGSADGVASLMNYVILTVGALLAATAAGFNATQLTVVAGALSVGIGFGLQNIVNNFISGLILIFERPISVGDRIAAGSTQQVGIVTRIGIRASTVRTFDGAEVVVPNGDLISKEVTNWTLSDMQRRLELRMGVEYGTDPQKVLAILDDVAATQEGVLQDPKATAVFDGFGDSSLNFRLLYWVPMEALLEVKTAVNLAVHAALKSSGVKVAFPRRDLRIKGAEGLAGLDTEDEESERPSAVEQPAT